MDAGEFTNLLRREGFTTIVEVERKANARLDSHSHPFVSKALILWGEPPLAAPPHSQDRNDAPSSLWDSALKGLSIGPAIPTAPQPTVSRFGRSGRGAGPDAGRMPGHFRYADYGF